MVNVTSDEGAGDVIVHTRVGHSRFDAVKSTFETDFRQLLLDYFMLKHLLFTGRGVTQNALNGPILPQHLQTLSIQIYIA